MRSLTTKLTAAFLAVSMVGIALMALFIGRATTAEFDSYLLDQQRSGFVSQASEYYGTTGSWAGAGPHFRAAVAAPVPGSLRQQGNAAGPGAASQAPPQQQPNPFVLADQSGYVIVPGAKLRVGERIPPRELERGVAVAVGGLAVGTVLTADDLLARDPREESYLTRSNQGLLVAALGATAVALLLGLIVARSLAGPLRNLTAASRAMARGEFGQSVPVRSRDELGELGAAFNQMSADLARANQLRRQMTADIAHDLRTPLTVVGGYIESLRDGVLQPTTERFEVIHAEVRHLQQLVEDLRTLSLADAGELKLNRQPVSPQALLQETASAFSHQARGRNITLQVRAEPSLPEITVDRVRMAQLLSNLVSNAIRYTPDSGRIILSARREDDRLALVVEDNGRGIAPELLSCIFERFYRGDASREQESGESGLGLAIARSLAEAHGGGISAASAGIGQGSSFLITLPLGRST